MSQVQRHTHKKRTNKSEIAVQILKTDDWLMSDEYKKWSKTACPFPLIPEAYLKTDNYEPDNSVTK